MPTVPPTRATTSARAVILARRCPLAIVMPLPSAARLLLTCVAPEILL